MKKQKDYTLLLIGIILSIAVLVNLPGCYSSKHHCIDNTHKTCDGNCECDGLGCE
jgi:hypothetical protein